MPESEMYIASDDSRVATRRRSGAEAGMIGIP
jgi:hypothetical protein